MAFANVPTARVHSRAQLLRLADAAKLLWAEYWVRKAERDTVSVLQSLDDRTLKDIGIDRSEIESVVYGRAQTASKSVAWQYNIGRSRWAAPTQQRSRCALPELIERNIL